MDFIDLHKACDSTQLEDVTHLLYHRQIPQNINLSDRKNIGFDKVTFSVPYYLASSLMSLYNRCVN